MILTCESGNNRGVLQMTRSGLRYGFTLIELLVVVAIIALLVSVLIPALQSARERTRQVICSQNMKHQFNGLLMYCDTFDGMLPHSAVHISPGDPEPPGGIWYQYGDDIQVFWQQMVAEYVNVQRKGKGWGVYASGYEIFYCPSMALPGPHESYNLWKPIWGNYGVNESFCTRDGESRFSYTKIPEPSERILILDAGAYMIEHRFVRYPAGYFWYVPSAIVPGTDPAAASGFPITPWLQDDYQHGRHSNGKVNIIWADGHATLVPGLEIGDRYRAGDRRWWSPVEGGMRLPR